MNQKGFMTISMVMWAPVFAIFLLGFGWSIWLINSKRALHNICHEAVLNAQEELVENNNWIMSYNFYAGWLITEKKVQTAAIMFGPPPVKIAAKARKKMIIAEQKALRAKQQFFFNKARVMSAAPLAKTQFKFSDKVSRLFKLWGKAPPLFNFVYVSPMLPESQLKIKWKDIAPVYKRDPNHWKIQGISARWEIPIYEIVPSWFKDSPGSHKTWKQAWGSQTLTGECHSHPHEKGGTWTAAIGKGNH